jgi:four helix bundle protein
LEQPDKGDALNMDAESFKARTKNLALRIIRLVDALPNDRTADVIGKQLIRSGTSIGANYRAACRAKSPRDMIAKLKTVEEEADESMYWMELLIDAELIPQSRITNLLKETDEILAMSVASIKTLRASGSNRQSSIPNRKSHD